jgi:hypothetical protein
MARRQDAAPNDEWVLMYRDGLPGRHIAELAGVPVSTVSYHLRLARAADPELRPAHEKASTSRARVTARPGTNAAARHDGPGDRAVSVPERGEHRGANPGGVAGAAHSHRPSARAWPSCLAGRQSAAPRRTRSGGIYGRLS